MKCSQCLYVENCNLKVIAKDITGCLGHSKEKPIEKGYQKCSCCGEITHENRLFFHSNGKDVICFNCF